MNKVKLTPELRFPEFTNEGEWKESLLGSVVEMKGRIGYRGYTIQDIVEKGKGAITLSPSNFNENGQLNFEKCTYISWDKYEESPEIQLEEGQTVLVKTASVGKTAYVDKLPEKATVNPQIVVLKPKTIHNRFLAFTVSHYNTQDQIRNNVGAGAIPNISQEIISKLKILLPPDKKRKEQQKIASCLTSLDEVINTHSQKLELLKDHKKGLMQNFFPQEGEKVPKYRFKEFEKEGEWVEKKLGAVGEFLGGGTPSRTNGEYWAGNIPWISSSDIYENDIHNISISQYINELAIVESATKIIPKGSVLFVSRVGVGKLAINKEELCTSQDFISFIPTEILNLYVAYFYSANKNSLQSLSQGTSIKGFSKSDLEDSNIKFPTNPKEQQKIATCLSYLDAIITAQTEKIEQLKLHKTGLMQGLFPKIND